MPRIEVEPGVSVFVQDVGAGPCVVLLHGWALSHEVWDRRVGAESLKTLMRTDQVDSLARVDMPVVQILGRQDRILSKRGAAWIQEQLRDCRQVWLDDCGHFPMFEAPDAFDSALLEATSKP